VSAITVPAVKSIHMDNLRLFQSMAAFFVSFAFHVRRGMRTASDLTERGFAEFARVPYESPLSRQQWEDLWEAEKKSGPFSRCAMPIGWRKWG